MLLHDLLARRQIATESAFTGQTGLEKARQKRFDLILLDMTLPDMDGTDVCKMLKADFVLKDIPVIIITGNDTSEERERGSEAGAVDFIPKPFRLADLEGRIMAAIHQKAGPRD